MRNINFQLNDFQNSTNSNVTHKNRVLRTKSVTLGTFLINSVRFVLNKKSSAVAKDFLKFYILRYVM